jgi:hypothetical protein
VNLVTTAAMILAEKPKLKVGESMVSVQLYRHNMPRALGFNGDCRMWSKGYLRGKHLWWDDKDTVIALVLKNFRR